MTQPQHLINWLVKQNHIKQKAISEKSGVPEHTISRLLNDKTTPTMQHYRKLLHFSLRIGYKPKNIDTDNQ